MKIKFFINRELKRREKKRKEAGISELAQRMLYMLVGEWDEQVKKGYYTEEQNPNNAPKAEWAKAVNELLAVGFVENLHVSKSTTTIQ